MSLFQLPTRFGRFGGCYAPETLMRNLVDLERAFLAVWGEPAFEQEYARLIQTFAGRPTPLYHARRLSQELGLEVWLKREDLLHTGAHKLNNALGQGLLAQHMGKTRLLAETGAGQHGVATATVAALLGLQCRVYMGAVDVERQKPNVERMQLLGAEVFPVESGQKTLKDAVNEALRAWTSDPEAHYLLGSALGPHPFPTIVAACHELIGREAKAQFAAAAGGLPDAAIACVGGGSNAIGLFRAFLRDSGVALYGIEAGGIGNAPGQHAARWISGREGILHGTRTLVLCDADGQVQGTHSISAGLDYPAVGPEHAHLAESGRARYEAASDETALLGFRLLARLEGILPALESSHAVGFLVRERQRFAGQRVVIGLSGRGDKDLATLLPRLAQGGAS